MAWYRIDFSFWSRDCGNHQFLKQSVIVGTISFSNNQWLWEPSVSQTMLKNLSYKEVEILTLNLREFKFLWENLNISLGERAATWLIFLCETPALKKTNKLITAFRNICTEETAAGLENKKTNKQTKRFVLVCPSIASYLGRNFQ